MSRHPLFDGDANGNRRGSIGDKMAQGRLLKTPHFTESDKKRFWSNVVKTSYCWNWTGSKTEYGYARFFIGGKNYRVHRLSYFLHTGKEPGKLCVLHHCDNRICVNPDHLWLGTDADNTKDRDIKGRNNQPSGDRNGSRLHPEKLKRGEKHPGAKITDDDVRIIRRLRQTTNITLQQLASQFGICRTAVTLIIKRKNWRHVK